MIWEKAARSITNTIAILHSYSEEAVFYSLKGQYVGIESVKVLVNITSLLTR